jgi:hypothetical protein
MKLLFKLQISLQRIIDVLINNLVLFHDQLAKITFYQTIRGCGNRKC